MSEVVDGVEYLVYAQNGSTPHNNYLSMNWKGKYTQGSMFFRGVRIALDPAHAVFWQTGCLEGESEPLSPTDAATSYAEKRAVPITKERMEWDDEEDIRVSDLDELLRSPEVPPQQPLEEAVAKEVWCEDMLGHIETYRQRVAPIAEPVAWEFNFDYIVGPRALWDELAAVNAFAKARGVRQLWL